MEERTAGDLSSNCHYSGAHRSVDVFMESGRHFANSLSAAAEEQELGPRRDVDAGTSHSHLYIPLA